jgi:hypothetical protein
MHWRAPSGAGQEIFAMSIERRPAIPAALPRAGAQRDTDRLRRWCSTAVTAFTSAIAILIVALAAVVLGIT